MRHEVFNEHRELVAEAQDIIVFFDFNKNTKLTIPNKLREKFEQLEQRKFDPEP